MVATSPSVCSSSAANSAPSPARRASYHEKASATSTEASGRNSPDTSRPLRVVKLGANLIPSQPRARLGTVQATIEFFLMPIGNRHVRRGEAIPDLFANFVALARRQLEDLFPKGLRGHDCNLTTGGCTAQGNSVRVGL